MVHPVSIPATSGRSEAVARRSRADAPNQNAPSLSERDALTINAPEAATPPEATGSNVELSELGDQFAGLTRLLDDIKTVGKGMPYTDVDAMLAPVFGVLTGVMNRIMGAPAATLEDLGLKAQVVMWAKRDWWQGDAQLGWQDAVTKILLEQTIAAAGFAPTVSVSS